MKSKITLVILFFAVYSCYSPPERECAKVKTGSFEFISIVEGDTLVSRFDRFEDFEIDYYQGKADTSTVKWVNDCEFVLRNINPKSLNEQQAVYIKILSTDESGYSFEYGILKDAKRLKGYAKRLK
jgi:hypothetical protein